MPVGSGWRTLGIVIVALGVGWAVGRSTTNAADSPSRDWSGDPTAAFRSILTIDDPGDRATELAAFLDQTDPLVHASPFFDLLIDRDSDLIVDEITEILFADWWATADPDAAFNNPLHPRWKDRHPWMRYTLKSWAQVAPMAAARAVATMPGGPALGRLEAARAVVEAWLALEEIPDPALLLRVVEQLEPIARSGALEMFVATLIERRGEAFALETVRGVQPDNNLESDIHHELLTRAGVALAKHDINSAVRWAEEWANTTHGLGIQKHLAYYWGLREGQPAIEWALSLPPQKGRNIVIKRAWLSFSRKHRPEAREWILARPATEDMRGIYTDFLRRTAETEPNVAMDLAGRTLDPELVDTMRAAVGEGWIKVDPEAALAWLAQAGLPAELEARVRASAGKPRARTPQRAANS